MDEKEKFKKIFLLIKIFLLLISKVIIIILPIMIIVALVNKIALIEVIKTILFIYLIVIGLTGGFGLIYAMGYFAKNKINEINSKDYIRDLSDVKYGSAIASLLLDNNTEIAKDYTSTIIDLHRKKYIEIEMNNNEYKFHLINNSIINLAEHERYVIECIIDEKKFDDKIYKQKLQEDAIKLGYLKNRKPGTVLKVIGLQFLKIIIGCVLANMFPEDTVMYNIVGVIALMLGFSVFAEIFRLIKNGKSLVRTKSGEIEAKKWKEFKNFINDYTLIKNKDIKDVVLFKEYLSFAIAVGEANKIEKFIINNEVYRKLIYKQLR